MRVLVTGGCGFLGSHICEMYRQQGWEVVSYDNMTKSELLRTGYQTEAARDHNWNVLQALGVETIRADVRNLDELLDFASGCDYICHTAAQPAVTISIEDPLLDLATDVTGTVHVLEAARRHHIPVACCSTVQVYGNWLNRELPDLIQCVIDDGLAVKSFDIGDGYVNINTSDDIALAENQNVQRFFGPGELED